MKWRVTPSPRQRQLLLLAASGMSAMESAEALGLTRKTVYFYWKEILAKYAVENRHQAVMRAMREGHIVPLPNDTWQFPREGRAA